MDKIYIDGYGKDVIIRIKTYHEKDRIGVWLVVRERVKIGCFWVSESEHRSLGGSPGESDGSRQDSELFKMKRNE